MNNLLTLHEAIFLVLFKDFNNWKSFDEIEAEINKRNLFPNRKGGISLAEQIKLRTVIQKRYKKFFDYSLPDKIRINIEILK